MYLQKCVEYKKKKKKKKRSYEDYSFVRKCDRSNRRCKGGNYRFLVILNNISSPRVLLRSLSSRLIFSSPEILGLFSDEFPFSVSLDLSFLVFLDLIYTDL